MERFRGLNSKKHLGSIRWVSVNPGRTRMGEKLNMRWEMEPDSLLRSLFFICSFSLLGDRLIVEGESRTGRVLSGGRRALLLTSHLIPLGIPANRRRRALRTESCDSGKQFGVLVGGHWPGNPEGTFCVHHSGSIPGIQPRKFR